MDLFDRFGVAAFCSTLANFATMGTDRPGASQGMQDGRTVSHQSTLPFVATGS
jgi:hypothetical protein